jgi:hypothetical protein
MQKICGMFFFLLLLAVIAVCLGCATSMDNESDIPWNAPQPWEGSPMIPGLEGQ